VQENPESEIDLPILKRYVAYCKMSQTSVFRTGGKQAIPIPIRQLEAIRTSEALAKTELSSIANEKYVNEAIRLFKVSTLDAASSNQYTVEGMLLQNLRR